MAQLLAQAPVQDPGPAQGQVLEQAQGLHDGSVVVEVQQLRLARQGECGHSWFTCGSVPLTPISLSPEGSHAHAVFGTD